MNREHVEAAIALTVVALLVLPIVIALSTSGLFPENYAGKRAADGLVVVHHLGELLVTLQAGPRLPEVVLNKVDAFLQSRFPDERCTLAPGKLDGDHGFMVLPMVAATPGIQCLKLPFAVAARLNEIADALEEFRAAGWTRLLH